MVRFTGIDKNYHYIGMLRLFLLFFILIMFLFISMIPGSGFAAYEGEYDVKDIIDGDTFELTDGKQVRLLGIDAPEIGESCSTEARQKLTVLISGKTVRLEKDVSETDGDGRFLRYVFIGSTFVNRSLVYDGYAWAVTYPPDVKYASDLTDAEKSARDNDRGCLWSNLPLDDADGYLQVSCFIDILLSEWIGAMPILIEKFNKEGRNE